MIRYLASFNHGDYYREAIPLLGLAFSWISAIILTLAAFVILFLRKLPRRILAIWLVVWILTGVCFLLHSKISGDADSNDILITVAPAMAASLIYIADCVIAWKWKPPMTNFK